MANVRKAQSTTQAPVMIGQPNRPGQVEGGNNDPVVVAGEEEIRLLNLLDPSDTVKSIAYREDSNEAVIITDEPSAFNYMEYVTGVAERDSWVTPQSKVLYYNGNTLIDVGDYKNGPIPIIGDYPNQRYKLNAAAWRPMVQPTTNIDRVQLQDKGKAGKPIGDMCMLVGEQLGQFGGINGQGAIILIRPTQIGNNRDMYTAQPDGASPITFMNPSGGIPALDGVDLYGVCWKRSLWPAGAVDQFALNVAYVVGTERDGASYIPKAFKILIRTGEWNESGVAGTETFQIIVEDLDIEDTLGSGILYGCDYDDEEDVLYVTGSVFDGDRQIFSSYSESEKAWTDRGSALREEFSSVDGTDGYLIQDNEEIRLVSNSSTFISDIVKRGQSVWVDIADWADGTSSGQEDLWNSGLWSIKRVKSETELILDFKMPNQTMTSQVPPDLTAFTRSLFRWGFLQADITDSATTIVFDVPAEMWGTNTVADFLAGLDVMPTVGGGTIYIEGEQIILPAPTSQGNIVVDGKTYRRFTYDNCQRGANGTTGIPHIANYNMTSPGFAPAGEIYWRNRTVAVVEEAADGLPVADPDSLGGQRDFKVFSKLKDCKLNRSGTSVFITGDNGAFVRYDIFDDIYVDYRERTPVVNLDFGNVKWKPDKDIALVVANQTDASYIYRLQTDFLTRLDVPSSGVVYDVDWTPDGLTAIIGGKSMFRYTRKVNVEMTEKEPKTIPVRYLFSDVALIGPTQGESNVWPVAGIIQSDALTIDDLDSDTLSLFILTDAPEGDISGADVSLGPLGDFEYEVRIYLSGRGDQNYWNPFGQEKRFFWRSIMVSDVQSVINPKIFPSYPFPTDGKLLSWTMVKLPPWAKYVAVDLINRMRILGTALAETQVKVTIGVQGGVR